MEKTRPIKTLRQQLKLYLKGNQYLKEKVGKIANYTQREKEGNKKT